MDHATKTIVTECTRASDESRMAFPQVIATLAAAGIERYTADLARAEKTYYLPDGASEIISCHALETPPAHAFSAAGVDAAVRAIQAGGISYGEFCARIAASGCVSYLVSLPGRRAVYSGRTGECHVEMFP